MRIIIILLGVIAAFPSPLAADSWTRPVERDYYSSNKDFVAHVTPAKKEAKARLEVFQIKDAGRIALWECTLGNEGAPWAIFLTDNGRYVATVNENSRRVHGGMGDYVIAFYGKTGLIKNYSLEQILHYTGPANRLSSSKELGHIVTRSVSGRGWASEPIFFDKQKEKLYFCVWLLYGKYWLAWDVTTGEEVKITGEMKDRWNKRGLKWALPKIKEPRYSVALKFVAAMKRPEDRKLIESFLSGNGFETSANLMFRPKGEDWQFIRYNCRNSNRAMAERLLAEWDEKPARDPNGPGQKYYHLGVISGRLRLPRAPQVGDGLLGLYLIGSGKAGGDWHAPVPVHRLTTYFSKDSSCFRHGSGPGANIPFRMEGITPGTYTLKCIWDLTEPRSFGHNYIKGPPGLGDYENKNAPTITIKAGQKVENVEIDCTDKVTE